MTASCRERPDIKRNSSTLSKVPESEQSGSNETFVDATIEGDPVLIAFNVRYLREVLDVITTPDVALETTAPASPGVIRPVGDDSFIHVIMPMHLGN